MKTIRLLDVCTRCQGPMRKIDPERQKALLKWCYTVTQPCSKCGYTVTFMRYCHDRRWLRIVGLPSPRITWSIVVAAAAGLVVLVTLWELCKYFLDS